MESIWSSTCRMKERERLKGDIRADVAVIGGGMAGILTAYSLEREGVHTVVLEAEQIGGGQTKNTTAKITSQHGMFCRSFVEKKGKDTAEKYVQANQAAVEEYKKITNYDNTKKILNEIKLELPDVPNLTDISKFSRKRDEKILEEIIKPKDELIKELYKDNLSLHKELSKQVNLVDKAIKYEKERKETAGDEETGRKAEPSSRMDRGRRYPDTDTDRGNSRYDFNREFGRAGRRQPFFRE